MKYNLAIIEDDVSYARYLKKLIVDNTDSFEIDCYNLPAVFLNLLCENTINYDVLFLDIDMPEIDGIKLAQKLQAMDKSPIIVFVTNKTELVYEAFGLNVYKFICKEQVENEIKKLLYNLVHNVLNYKTVVIKTGLDTIMLKKEDVVLIEKYNKTITISTKTGCIDVKKKTLEEILLLLNDERFQYANRSAIINLKYVSKISKMRAELKCINREIDISRYRFEQLLNEFYKLMRNW